jgi:hypothetical protein
MVQETATLKAEEVDVAPEVTFEAEPTAEKPEAAPEKQEEQVAATEDEEAPEAPVWSADRYDGNEDFHTFLRDTDHPVLAERMEVASREGERRGQRQGAGEAKHIQDTLTKVNQGLQGMTNAMLEATDAGGLTKPALIQALQNFAPGIAAMNEYTDDHKQAKFNEGEIVGVQKAMNNAAILAEVEVPGLGQLMLDFAEDFRMQDRGVGTFTTFVKRLTKAVGDKREEAGYQRGLKQRKTSTAEVQRAATAKTKGPPSSQGVPGGEKTDKELLLDKSTPVEELIEIRTRQKKAQGF